MKLPAASCGVSKRNCAVAGPAFAQKSYGAVRLAFHPCSKLQGIQAKANKTGTSLEVIKLFFKGAYPALPPVHYPVVDVCDLAELHIRAMASPGAGGRRLIGAADTLSMSEMGQILRNTFPDLCPKNSDSHLTGLSGEVSGDFRPRPEVGHTGHRRQTGR
jgi:nucleoside-diphosphate-sugar epimerase